MFLISKLTVDTKRRTALLDPNGLVVIVLWVVLGKNWLVFSVLFRPLLSFSSLIWMVRSLMTDVLKVRFRTLELLISSNVEGCTNSSCLEFCLCVVWHTVLNAERAGREVGEPAAHHLSQAPNQFTLTLSTLSTRPSLLYNTLISSSTTQTSNHPHCLYKPRTNQVN